MLYLLASGQVHTGQDVAQLLGVHRHTIGHWLASYEAGVLEALLEVYVPAGKPVSLPPDAHWSAWSKPCGSRLALPPMRALRQWVKPRYQLDVNYHTVYTIVRARFNAKLKVPRPNHTKKA
jgi:hypothetical protein